MSSDDIEKMREEHLAKMKRAPSARPCLRNGKPKDFVIEGKKPPRPLRIRRRVGK